MAAFPDNLTECLQLATGPVMTHNNSKINKFELLINNISTVLSDCPILLCWAWLFGVHNQTFVASAKKNADDFQKSMC